MSWRANSDRPAVAGARPRRLWPYFSCALPWVSRAVLSARLNRIARALVVLVLVALPLAILAASDDEGMSIIAVVMVGIAGAFMFLLCVAACDRCVTRALRFWLFQADGASVAELTETATLEALSSLPVCKWDASAEPAECALCLEQFRTDDLVRHLPCSHKYHGECIDRWFTSSALQPQPRSLARTPSRKQALCLRLSVTSMSPDTSLAGAMENRPRFCPMCKANPLRTRARTERRPDAASSSDIEAPPMTTHADASPTTIESSTHSGDSITPDMEPHTQGTASATTDPPATRDWDGDGDGAREDEAGPATEESPNNHP